MRICGNHDFSWFTEKADKCPLIWKRDKVLTTRTVRTKHRYNFWNLQYVLLFGTLWYPMKKCLKVNRKLRSVSGSFWHDCSP